MSLERQARCKNNINENDSLLKMVLKYLSIINYAVDEYKFFCMTVKFTFFTFILFLVSWSSNFRINCQITGNIYEATVQSNTLKALKTFFKNKKDTQNTNKKKFILSKIYLYVILVIKLLLLILSHLPPSPIRPPTPLPPTSPPSISISSDDWTGAPMCFATSFLS